MFFPAGDLKINTADKGGSGSWLPPRPGNIPVALPAETTAVGTAILRLSGT